IENGIKTIHKKEPLPFRETVLLLFVSNLPCQTPLQNVSNQNNLSKGGSGAAPRCKKNRFHFWETVLFT
ncbi:MAG: hypothetical protein II517_00355, partial [Ruminococcus sp.]|nr:hypothetical protein [Ruminococcus sp.]